MCVGGWMWVGGCVCVGGWMCVGGWGRFEGKTDCNIVQQFELS